MSSFPYQIEGSYALIKHAKTGNIKAIQQLYDINKNIIHEFDHNGRTCLHWATIKQNEIVVKCFVQEYF